MAPDASSAILGHLKIHALFIVVSLILICTSIGSLSATGENEFNIESTEVYIYRDGVARIIQIVEVNETISEINLQLLTSDASNILVIDESSEPHTYNLTDQILEIDSLGSTKITVEYESQQITSKNGSVWTVKLKTYTEMTLILPEEATIIYLSDIPTEITSKQSRPIVSLQPAEWEVSYILPFESNSATTSTIITSSPTTSETQTTSTSATTATTTETAATTTTTQEPSAWYSSNITLYLLLPVALLAGAAGLVVYFRHRLRAAGLAAEEILKDEDRIVLDFIASKGGRVMEVELREQFALPRTSMWRLVKRLERRGFVSIRKVGLQNEIVLIRRHLS